MNITAPESIEIQIGNRLAYRRLIAKAIIKKFACCATDDVLAEIGEGTIPSERADDLRWARRALREIQAEQETISIPANRIREAHQIAQFVAEDLGDELTSLGAMDWDDVGTWDAEDFANRVYALQEVIRPLTRAVWELDKAETVS